MMKMWISENISRFGIEQGSRLTVTSIDTVSHEKRLNTGTVTQYDFYRT